MTARFFVEDAIEDGLRPDRLLSAAEDALWALRNKTSAEAKRLSQFLSDVKDECECLPPNTGGNPRERSAAK